VRVPNDRYSETRSAAFEQSPVPAAIFDLGAEGTIGRIVDANAAFARFLGRRSEDVVGMRAEAVGPDHETWREALREAAIRGASRTPGIRARRAEGPWAEAELHVAAMPGTPLAVAQLIDVSGHDRGIRALRESEKRLQAIVDNVQALVWVKDLDGRYLLMNRLCRQRFGIGSGMTDTQWAPREAARDYLVHDQEVLGLGEPLEFHEDVYQDGVARTYLSLKFPLFDHDGRAYAIGGVATDITALKQAEVAAGEARDQAEQANRAKSEFLSRMSHELRTPLNSILGHAQLMVMGAASSPAESAARIVDAGNHLLSMINEILEIARIEEGGEVVALEPIHAPDPLQDAVEIVRPIAAERHIRIEVDLHGGLFTFVRANHRRLKQVLINVIANGVQYSTDRSRVHIAFEHTEDGILRYLVSDSGSGIPVELSDRVFAPFDRLGRGGSVEQGTGLGLALSKTLIESMGGAISYRTLPEAGTTFVVELAVVERPADAVTTVFQHDAVLAAPASGGQRPARVLYVEDNPDNVEVVRQALASMGPGVDLETAPNAADGLRKAREGTFDVVLLDLHLPDGSGRELIPRLRAADSGCATSIVVVSADATHEQIAASMAAGADHYLTKPLDLQALLSAIAGSMSA